VAFEPLHLPLLLCIVKSLQWLSAAKKTRSPFLSAPTLSLYFHSYRWKLLGFYWGSLCLYLLAPECFLLFSVVTSVSGLIFRSLIHFELILVQGDRHGSSFSFLQTGNHFSQQHLLKRLSFLHHIFLAPLSKMRWV
jgi:hypothetical protein